VERKISPARFSEARVSAHLSENAMEAAQDAADPDREPTDPGGANSDRAGRAIDRLDDRPRPGFDPAERGVGGHKPPGHGSDMPDYAEDIEDREETEAIDGPIAPER
jgi:hypothetical protein